MVYHASFVDEEALDMLEANKDKHFVAPWHRLTDGAVPAQLHKIIGRRGATLFMTEHCAFEASTESVICGERSEGERPCAALSQGFGPPSQILVGER